MHDVKLDFNIYIYINILKVVSDQVIFSFDMFDLEGLL